MSKLQKDQKFIDLSDYGRPVARLIANSLKDTFITPIHITWLFIIAGLAAAYCIIFQHYLLALILLITKSTLDAADGELSRVKNTPSYTGRYFDSIADILLNFILLLCIWYVTEVSFWVMLIAFVGIQLQGTLYNYYYVILRNNNDGDTTSRIFETEAPEAMAGENQSTVNLLYYTYNALYVIFDKSIYYLDPKAVSTQHFPKWYMTALSSFGLGFQLLILGVLMALGYIHFVIPYFIACYILIFIFIGIRRLCNWD